MPMMQQVLHVGQPKLVMSVLAGHPHIENPLSFYLQVLTSGSEDAVMGVPPASLLWIPMPGSVRRGPERWRSQCLPGPGVECHSAHSTGS